MSEPKSHVPLVSFVIVAYNGGRASFGLQLCNCGHPGRQAVSQSGVWVGGLIKKILYLAADLCFLFLMLYLMLGGLILFCKGDFHSVRCL